MTYNVFSGMLNTTQSISQEEHPACSGVDRIWCKGAAKL